MDTHLRRNTHRDLGKTEQKHGKGKMFMVHFG
jgi:hypothetical protein